jgi:hypothetical protein
LARRLEQFSVKGAAAGAYFPDENLAKSAMAIDQLTTAARNPIWRTIGASPRLRFKAGVASPCFNMQARTEASFFSFSNP